MKKAHNDDKNENINKLLNELYYSLSSPAAYSGKNRLIKEAEKQGLTHQDVDHWLSTQLAYTLHKPVKKSFKTRPVVVYDIDEQWQADLVDMSKLAKRNTGYKYLLVCIDVLSKYAWIEPLKTKTSKELKEVLQKVFLTDNRQPKLLQTDKGTEFLNTLVKNMLKHRNIKLFTTNSERKASVVERLNRTMKKIMYQYFTRHNTWKYIDVLPDLVNKYNSSYHRSIKMSPKDVNNSNVPLVWINLYEGRIQPISKENKRELIVGDTVRISLERTTFHKAYKQGWTEEIFIITHKLLGNPLTYKLKDQADESIKGVFYVDELQKIVEPSTYRIEKIIRKKKSSNGKLVYLVKWRGYSDKFNSFVTAEDIEKL